MHQTHIQSPRFTVKYMGDTTSSTLGRFNQFECVSKRGFQIIYDQLNRTSNIKCTDDLMKGCNTIVTSVIFPMTEKINQLANSSDYINLHELREIMYSSKEINILPLQIAHLLIKHFKKNNYLNNFIFDSFKGFCNWKDFDKGVEFINITIQNLTSPISISCEDCQTIISKFTNVKEKIELNLYSYEIQKILYLSFILILNNSYVVNNFYHDLKLLKNKLYSSSNTIIGPQRLGPQRLEPQRLGPSGLTPSGLGPQNLGPSGLTPSGLRPQRLGPSGSLTPSGLGPQDLGPLELGPPGLGPPGLKQIERLVPQELLDNPDLILDYIVDLKRLNRFELLSKIIQYILN